jgi:aminoglycoside phosphotransferase (APT) family kinase protein
MSKWCISIGFVREAEDPRPGPSGACQPHRVAEDDADVVARVHRVDAVDHPGAPRIVERDFHDLEEVARPTRRRAVVDEQPVVLEIRHARGGVRAATELGVAADGA